MDSKNILILFGLTAMLSSCANDPAENPAATTGEAVRFEISTVKSRSVTNTDNTTEFVSGDRIGIFGAKGATGANIPFLVDSEGKLQAEAGGGIYYNTNGGNTADFFAYYPYTEGQNGATVSFQVASDQSTADLFNASDFMTATTKGITTGSADAVSLIFQHRLAVVQLEVVTSSANRVKGASLCNVQSTAEWNWSSDAMTTTGEAANIKMWGRTDDGLTYWAAVPAQTVAGGSRLLTLEIGDKAYAFTTTSPINLNEGMIKKFRIGVGEKDQIVVFSSELTVTPWNEDPDIVEGEGEEVQPEPLMAVEDFSIFNPTLIAKTKEEITSPGWYLFHLYDTDVLEVAADGNRDKVLHIKRVIQDGKTALEWHNGAYYYAAANPQKRVYTLTFTARSSFAENMKGNQLRIGAYLKDAEGKDHFVAMRKGEDLVTTVYHQVPSEEYATYTLEFDMSKVSTVHNGNAQTAWSEPDADMLKLVNLYITSNAAGIDFWIDDMSWK